MKLMTKETFNDFLKHNMTTLYQEKILATKVYESGDVVGVSFGKGCTVTGEELYEQHVAINNTLKTGEA